MQKLSTSIGAIAVAAVVTISQTAFAQDDDTTWNDAAMTGIGTSISIGGGVFGFTDDVARDLTATGGSWTARVAVGTRLPITVEAGYIGSANDIEALGLDEAAALVGNGVEGIARFNPLALFQSDWNLGSVRIDPYVFGGIAYRNYRLVNDDFNTSNVRDEDNMGEVPLGAGIAMGFGQFVFDVRGEYRAAFSDELIGGSDEDLFSEPDDAGLSSYSVNGRLGWEF